MPPQFDPQAAYGQAGMDISRQDFINAYNAGVRPTDSAGAPVQATIDQNLRGTLAIRLPGITGVIKFGDWRWYSVFNRMVWVDDAQGEQQFFSNGLGQQISGGTRRALVIDTNQPRSGDSGLPTDWAAYLYQVGLSIEFVSGTDDTDVGGDGASPTDYDPGTANSAQPNARILFEVQKNILFTIFANDKWRQIGHFFDYPAGRGAYNLGNNDVGFDQPINGVPSPRDSHQIIVPIQLDANQQYNVNANAVVPLALDQAQVVNDTTNTSICMECNLRGLYKVKVV